MSTNHEQIYRTTPERTIKMMAIMLGICVAGGAIFFGLWDYWISMPAPVTLMGQADVEAPGAQTGQDIPVKLSFVEHPDDPTNLAFNALPGEEGNNPTIQASVGDRIIFDVANDGQFHSFGVTADEEGWEGIIPGTEIASGSNPLKPGESGTSEFIPSKEGTYYYVCTVPGHRALGMVGEIQVGPSEGAEPAEAAAPTGVERSFEVDFVESDDFRTYGFDALPGEEGSNPDFAVSSGDTVTFTAVNKGVLFHSFGITKNPEDYNNPLWGSEIGSVANTLKPGESGSSTFTAGAPGEYYYICTVPGHALQGMKGSFLVE